MATLKIAIPDAINQELTALCESVGTTPEAILTDAIERELRLLRFKVLQNRAQEPAETLPTPYEIHVN